MIEPVIIGDATLYRGDALEILPTIRAGSVDAVVTDPPYGLSFMGKDWDHGLPGEHFWRAVLRVAKPGAHLLAFGGTRTFHRLACAIEDAGWEIRDTVMWVYGSGFPKSLDVSKAIDKAAGAEREIIGAKIYGDGKPCHAVSEVAMAASAGKSQSGRTTHNAQSKPASPAAAHWQGWGTALKPAWEPVIVARKPLEGTVAANVLAHGTGGLNIDGCRVGTEMISVHNAPAGTFAGGEAGRGSDTESYRTRQGRWPANLIHDGSEEVVGLFPVTHGGTWNRTDGARHFNNDGEPTGYQTYGVDRSTGSAARFFYCAKASGADRDEGLRDGGVGALRDGGRSNTAPRINAHPTVKPTSLMRYLCRLVTPPGGIVLDPFMGSGSTGKAAAKEGLRFIGIEIEESYFRVACERIRDAMTGGPLLAEANL